MKPPRGAAARRPAPIPRCVAEWQIHPDDGQPGHVLIRLFGPGGNDPARIELRTGPATFGPDLTDPAVIRRMSWSLLEALQAMADEVEAAAGPPAPDPQRTIFDELTEATT